VMYMNKYGMLGAVVGLMALLIAGAVIPSASGSLAVIPSASGSFSYNSTDEFWDTLANDLPNILREAGFSETEISSILEGMRHYRGDEDINGLISEYSHLIFSVSKGSFYAFGCLLPHSPPMNLGETIQCGVLFVGMGDPAKADDLHVYIHEPTHQTLLNIPSPQLPDPFLWISVPITLGEVGEWQIVADFTKGGSIILTLDVVFQVIPESIIGVAGIVAGPLAVLAYKLRKKSTQ
jgi:hypothetical protein